MQSDRITIRVPQPLAEAYRSAPPERRRKMELYMTLRLRAFEEAPSGSLEEAWARLADEARARGLTDEKLEELLREIEAERPGKRENDDPHLGDGLAEGP